MNEEKIAELVERFAECKKCDIIVGLGGLAVIIFSTVKLVLN